MLFQQKTLQVRDYQQSAHRLGWRAVTFAGILGHLETEKCPLSDQLILNVRYDARHFLMDGGERLCPSL